MGTQSRIAAAVAASTLLIGATRLVAFAWPAPYHGEPLHTQDGVLIEFGNGNKAGGLTIRTVDGAKQEYATSLASTFEGKRITCFSMPTATLRCPDWPPQIVPNKTLVRVTYWMGENDGPGIGGPERVVKDVSAR